MWAVAPQKNRNGAIAFTNSNALSRINIRFSEINFSKFSPVFCHKKCPLLLQLFTSFSLPTYCNISFIIALKIFSMKFCLPCQPLAKSYVNIYI
jgi:hypothetical protein